MTKQITLICPNCNKSFEIPWWEGKRRTFCSGKCAQFFTKSKDKTWLEKRDSTNMERYGVKSPLESSELLQRYKDSIMEKYGVDNPFLVKEFRDKADATILERYGVKVATQNKDIALKVSVGVKNVPKDRTNFINIKWEKIINYCKETNLKPLFEREELEKKKIVHYEGNHFKFQCKTCDTIMEVMLSNAYLPTCPKCSKYKGYSIPEDEIYVFINNTYSGEILPKNRSLLKEKRLEIDLYLPEINLAIELNGIYWHSESLGKYKRYHLIKTEDCEKQNVQLIHIWDWEWIHKKPIIQSMLLNKLKLIPNKIYARKCEIREIQDIKILREFLENNHLQGYCNSKINLGLYYNDELVAIMTFGKNRFKKNSNEFELLRFCNKLNTNVIGGASKLFSHFIKNYMKQNEVIISFADRKWSQGNLYNNLGFIFDSYTNPSYFYWKGGNILKRMSCQKHKLHKILPKFDPLQSEYDNMLNNGYRRVWDCGNLKFTFTKP